MCERWFDSGDVRLTLGRPCDKDGGGDSCLIPGHLVLEWRMIGWRGLAGAAGIQVCSPPICLAARRGPHQAAHESGSPATTLPVDNDDWKLFGNGGWFPGSGRAKASSQTPSLPDSNTDSLFGAWPPGGVWNYSMYGVEP